MTLFSNLVDTSRRVGAASARKLKIRELAAFLRCLEAQEIAAAVHYLSGEIPQGRIGVGYAALQAAAAENMAATGNLSLHDVDGALTAIALLRGSGSASRRAAMLRDLSAQSTAEEKDFLLRLLAGDLRQGALGGVMLDAIATAADLPAAAVRRAHMYSADLGAIARAALFEPEALDRFQLTLFTPVAPMLAQTAEDVAEALSALGGELAFEWKMDGARIQVHKLAEDVRVYTRSLNAITDSVPEIVEAVRAFPQHSLVLDGEAIAFDANERPLPFQVTMRRFGRKLNVAAMRAELPIRGFFFDCLYADGASIAERPLRERFASLQRIVPATMQFPRLVTASPADADDFYARSLSSGHEGVMAKSLASPYEAGNRGATWLKIKRSHTLDLIVLAAEWGHGRRTGKLSNLHLGALDPATEEYVMLGKTFKGLTDAMLEWQTTELLKKETHRDAGTVYVKPELIVETAFSDLQASSRYPGGIALRLARVKRYREDKQVDDADTMLTVRKLYHAQVGSVAKSVQNSEPSDDPER